MKLPTLPLLPWTRVAMIFPITRPTQGRKGRECIQFCSCGLGGWYARLLSSHSTVNPFQPRSQRYSSTMGSFSSLADSASDNEALRTWGVCTSYCTYSISCGITCTTPEPQQQCCASELVEASLCMLMIHDGDVRTRVQAPVECHFERNAREPELGCPGRWYRATIPMRGFVAAASLNLVSNAES